MDNDAPDFDETDEGILASTISDETLEAAAGTKRGPHNTLSQPNMPACLPYPPTRHAC